MPAYAGFVADLPNPRVEFAPRTDEFTTFWSHGAGRGTYEQSRTEEGELVARITVREGELGTSAPVTPAGRVEVIANLPLG